MPPPFTQGRHWFMRTSRCGIQIIHYYSLRACRLRRRCVAPCIAFAIRSRSNLRSLADKQACRLASLDYHSAKRLHHSLFITRSLCPLGFPRTCHSRANAKNLVRRASVIITNASSVCLRQPPSPTGEGKLKRHHFTLAILRTH